MSVNADTARMSEVRGTFATSDQMQEAVRQLGISGFDRADTSMPSDLPGATLTDQSAPVSTEDDAQQVRTLGASTAATVAALAAAGVTVATGGAAIPVIAAAALAGSAAGGATYAATGSANAAEQQERDVRAEQGKLVLAVRTTTDEKRAQAESVLRAAGATDIQTID